jgi:hypothetical protein
MTFARVGHRLPPVTGIWINKFEIVMRPLRDRAGAQTTVLIETRTAAQASREATTRFPDMKVVSVTRVTPTVASIKAARTEADPAARRKVIEPIGLDVSGAVVPLRRTGSK